MKKVMLLLGLVGCMAWGQEKWSNDFEMDYNKMSMIDVNFDGYKDLVIPTKKGINMKGEIAFDIYVSTKSDKLIYSKELSEVLHGEIYLDKKNKRIYTYTYYNACGYIWTIYQVEWRKPLKFIEEFFSTGFLASGGYPGECSETGIRYKYFELPKTAVELYK